jgi:hypothetical protein
MARKVENVSKSSFNFERTHEFMLIFHERYVLPTQYVCVCVCVCVCAFRMIITLNSHYSLT